jgi:CheY-like chemotaxis protein
MKNIFVIEDNDSNYLLVEEILSDFDVRLTRAIDGKQFYSIIKERRVLFDLILMDLMLPDADGIELTKFLINERYKIPIIFISAYTERCEEVFDLGIDHFISKPIMRDIFLSIVRKYIELNEAKAKNS